MILPISLILISLLISLHALIGLNREYINGYEDEFCVVVDAGSTGTRVHVFHFLSRLSEQAEQSEDHQGEHLSNKFKERNSRNDVYNRTKKVSKRILIDELFIERKPGLSHFYTQSLNANQSNQESSEGYNYAKEASRSIIPLLEEAMAYIPPSYLSKKKTPIKVAATAGLRLIPQQASDRILEAIRSLLTSKGNNGKAYPFVLFEGDVSILTGGEEARFAWSGVNYLLSSHLHSSSLSYHLHSSSVSAGVVDLGGASMQIVFEPLSSYSSSSVDSDSSSLKDSIYEKSHLGYGLIEVRSRLLHSLDVSESVSGTDDMLEVTQPGLRERIIREYILQSQTTSHTSDPDMEDVRVFSNPCLPSSYMHYKPLEKVLIVGFISPTKQDGKEGYGEELGVMKRCSNLVEGVLNMHKCPSSSNTDSNGMDRCSIDGTVHPHLHATYTNHPSARLFLFSYFYDRVRMMLGMESMEFSEGWAVGDFKGLAGGVCSQLELQKEGHYDDKEFVEYFESRDHIKRRVGTANALKTYLYRRLHGLDDVDEKADEHLCMDLMYMYHVLGTGYALPDTQRVFIEKQIGGVEMGWSLGAALDLLDRYHAKQSGKKIH